LERWEAYPAKGGDEECCSGEGTVLGGDERLKAKVKNRI
jgi:hypothetical protein